MSLVELKLSDDPGDVISINPEMVGSVESTNGGKECYVLVGVETESIAEPYADVVAKLTAATVTLLPVYWPAPQPYEITWTATNTPAQEPK
jgi:hypothetical protein